MSGLQSFLLGDGGGGNLFTQVFNANGTFTPSTELLAKGGRVLVRGIGGGSSGAAAAVSASVGVNDSARRSPKGGNSGRFREAIVTVTGPVSVTIGNGGAAVTATAATSSGVPVLASGNAGTATSFGALLTCAGGLAVSVVGTKPHGGGGDGAAARGSYAQDGSACVDARGGPGFSGRGGGGGGVAWTTEYNTGIDGGGNGVAVSGIGTGATATATSGAANTGGGGGGAFADASNNGAASATSGAGGTGWLEVVWFE